MIPQRPSLKDGRGAWFPHSAPLHLWQTLYMARPLTQCEHALARGAEREATARGDPPPVRLAGDRAGRADQPSRVGARAPARRINHGIGVASPISCSRTAGPPRRNESGFAAEREVPQRRKEPSRKRDRGFESRSLQQRVPCEPDPRERIPSVACRVTSWRCLPSSPREQRGSAMTRVAVGAFSAMVVGG